MSYLTQRDGKTRIDLTGWDEPTLKRAVERLFEPHFDMDSEVRGIFEPFKQNVKIDYLLYPKPALINRGFIEDWIGLEVKAPSKNKTGHELLRQCQTYAESWFDGRLPAFVMMFPEFDYFLQPRQLATKFSEYMLYCNVAQLDVGYWKEDVDTCWRIHSGPITYFSIRDGLGTNGHALLKRRAGNCG